MNLDSYIKNSYRKRNIEQKQINKDFDEQSKLLSDKFKHFPVPNESFYYTLDKLLRTSMKAIKIKKKIKLKMNISLQILAM